MCRTSYYNSSQKLIHEINEKRESNSDKVKVSTK